MIYLIIGIVCIITIIGAIDMFIQIEKLKDGEN